jgi:hypothetical protein
MWRRTKMDNIDWKTSKKKIPGEVFEKYEEIVLKQYEAGELMRERARELLVDFYMEYEKE